MFRQLSIFQFLKKLLLTIPAIISPIHNSYGVFPQLLSSSPTALILKAKVFLKNTVLGFPGGTVVKNLPANAGDMGSSPGLGRSHVPWSN